MKKIKIPKSVVRQIKRLSVVKGKLMTQLRKTEAQAKQVDKRLMSYTKKYPNKALLMAAAGGAALGIGTAMLIRRKKKRR